MRPNLDWVVGSAIEAIEKWEFSWRFGMGQGANLIVTAHWQIIAEGRVSLANGDHEQQYGLPAPIDAVARATELLVGRKIERVSVDSVSTSLKIELEGSIEIRTFNDSSGYEAWVLHAPDGVEYIGQGGGNVAIWSENTE